MLEYVLHEHRLYLRGNIAEHIPGMPEDCKEHILLDLQDSALKPTTEEMAHFLDCVEKGMMPETSPEESLAGLEVIWELYKAEDENRLADLSKIPMPFK